LGTKTAAVSSASLTGIFCGANYEEDLYRCGGCCFNAMCGNIGIRRRIPSSSLPLGMAPSPSRQGLPLSDGDLSHTRRSIRVVVAGCGLRVAGCCEIAQLANSYYDNRDKRRKKTYTFWASVTLRYAQANSGGQA
jgi:hypothetical protein